MGLNMQALYCFHLNATEYVVGMRRFTEVCVITKGLQQDPFAFCAHSIFASASLVLTDWPLLSIIQIQELALRIPKTLDSASSTQSPPN